ncbi:sensor histidine kinase KdpD [Erythrobacter sp. HKB08]|uniref:sensor histidine kinase n=1 Tax=Erythrobacter sp. HKB08 TaxID=2502843 RepID=UPI0010090F9C|nr:HAMP domain-containing sensor histidine kinase [Erythrobacter sp. HKB08]
MAKLSGQFLARARVDGEAVLLEAQDPLATLQLRCGGELPGPLAIPELREAVLQCIDKGVTVSRAFSAFDGDETITAKAEIVPDSKSGSGCLLGITDWKAEPFVEPEGEAEEQRRLDVDRSVAELYARLDAEQRLLVVESEANDLAEAVQAMRAGAGRPWTDFVSLSGLALKQPMHWRLLDGTSCTIEGSEREWAVHLHPVGSAQQGFELYLVPDRILAPERVSSSDAAGGVSRSIGRDLAPVLRKPIARIIANAETIRTKMAGPIADDYSAYAADIATAGQHLLSLLDDLADLEVIEADDFSTAPDIVELGDVARRAIGILSVRAKENGIAIAAPAEEPVPATAEFRRVLQILLNLLGNAIRYSAEGTTVTVSTKRLKSRSRIIVADEGPGLDEEEQARVFEKFERLGRKGDGGSGLGLYISRRIARAMGGELTVKSAPGEGARFILDLPIAD